MKKISLIIIFCFGLSYSLKAQVNVMDSLSVADFYNQCNGPNWNNNTNWLTGPVNSWYGITVSGDRIIRINLNNNNLVGAVPSSLTDITALQAIYINDNELHSLPDLNHIPFVDDSLIIYNNYFTFQDLENNADNIRADRYYNYSPQKTIPVNQSEITVNNDTLWLDAQSLSMYGLGGGSNRYTWYHAGIDTVSFFSENPAYYKDQLTNVADSGVYICTLTNTMIPSLTLELAPIHVTIEEGSLTPMQQDSLALVDLYNQCNGPNWNNNTNWLSGPLSSWYGINVYLDRATIIDLSNNNLVGEVPNSLSNLNPQWGISIGNNELHSLPDLSFLTAPDTLVVRNNYFTFDDLEKNYMYFGTSNEYSPQKTIPVNQLEYEIVNGTLDLDAQLLSLYNLGGSSNRYTWYREVVWDTLSFDSPSPQYFKENIVNEADTGVYICTITNSMVPKLTLELAHIHVTMGEDLTPMQQDSLALVDLYNQCNGPNWNNNANWLSGPLSSWYGVGISNDRVSTLHLSNNNLNGDIPNLFSSLTSIYALVLSNNFINDISPLGSLPYIDTLILGTNNISNISGLENITNLNWVEFQNNNISDISPLAINPNLKYPNNYINLRGNPLNYDAYNMSIPILEARGVRVVYDSAPAILESDSLALVALYNNCNGPNWNGNENWLTGPISTWYGVQSENSRIIGLGLGYNNFNGTLPPEFGNLNALENLSLAGHNFSDYSAIANLTSLINLILSSCGISDLSFVTNLINIQDISLNDNDITDITALINNINIGDGDVVRLTGNPLSAQAIDIDIPILQSRGATVYYDNSYSDDPSLKYISTTGIDSPENGSKAQPLATIQYAIENANNGDTFILLNGTYESIDSYIGNNITIASEFIFSKDKSDIENTIIKNNSQGSAFTTQSATSFIGITFENNGGLGSFGGAINSEWDAGKIFVEDCVFKNNSALQEGGAIWVWGENASLEVNRCVFDGNTATAGSAILVNWGGKAEIRNSLFTNNSSANEGTVSNWNSKVSISNCTFIENISESNTVSGFHNSDSPDLDFPPVGVVRNSIFWGNGWADIGYWNTAPDVKYCNTGNAFSGEGNSTQIPEFVSSSDFHLRNTSPLINAGTPDTSGLGLWMFDLDRNERIQDDRIDIGCYEGGTGDFVREDPVFFPDSSLRKVLCDSLKVTPDGLTPTRLEYLTLFRANECDPPISDLTGLEKCSNLVHLELLNNNISGISPVAYLHKLEILYLDGNNIGSIWPVKNLTNIKELTFRDNNLTGLEDIGEKPNLTGIDISLNRISDFSLLRNYPNLEWILISDNTATSIKDIYDFPFAWALVARDLNLKTVEGLTNMPNLTRIHLARNQISDISFANNFNFSGGFEIPWNNVADISPLANQTELPWVSLHHNPISDISALASSPGITLAYLDNCKISDISVLSQLESVNNLHLNNNLITTLNPLLGCDSLSILQIANNPLTNKTIVEDYPILRPRLSEIDEEQQLSDLEIIYPNSTSGVVEGKMVEISWRDFGGTSRAQNINLDYSTDGGSSWVPILVNEQNDSSHLWVVPDLGGQAFLLKIEDADVPDDVRDTSENISFCNLSASFTSTKNDLELTFTNTSSGTNDSWYWNFGDGNNSNLENPVYSYQISGVYEVTLTAIDITSGCRSSIEKVIEAGTVACLASFDTTIIQESRLVSFADLSTGIIEEYSWDFGDHSSSSEMSPSHTYTSDGTYNVCLTVRNQSTGYISTSCKTISIINIPDIIAPVASFSYTKNDETLRAEFLNTTTGDVTDWHWTFGDGAFYDGQESSHTYSKYGTYNVCLNVSNSVAGINSSKCKEITIGNPPCILSSNFNYILNNETLTLNVTNLSSADANAWYWNFGDGSSSSLQNPVHTYSAPGQYILSLNSRNTDTECTDFLSKEIIVGTVDCIADFSYGVDMSKKSVSFSNLSTGQSEIFYWDFGDGNTSQLASPTHNYNAPGLYNASLTVSDANGLCMDQTQKQIQIQEILCDAGFTVFVDSLTMTIHLSPDVTGTYTSLFWELGDGYTSSSENIAYTFTNPGFYTVGLTTFNSENSCMDYYEEIVVIASPGEDVNAAFIYTVDDATRTVNFHNTSSGDNGTYTWDFGDGETSTDKDPEYTYYNGGFYPVCLTAFGEDENQSTRCKTIRVSPSDITNCLASFYYMVDSATLSAQFIDNSIGGINTWEWNFEGGGSSTEQDPLHSWEEPGYYIVHLRATNIQTGCFSDYYDLINVGLKNDGLITKFDYLRVDERFKSSGHPVDFVGVSIGDKSKIEWNFGDGTKNSTTLTPRHYFDELKIYEVCLTIEDPNTGESSTYCEYLQVEPSVGIEEEFENRFISENMGINIYPNPSNYSFTIDFNIPEKQYISLGIFDLQGRCIDVLINTQKERGEYKLETVGLNLKKGIYFIILKSKSQTFVKKIIKTGG